MRQILVNPYEANPQEIPVGRYTRIRFVLGPEWFNYVDVSFSEKGGVEIHTGNPAEIKANASNVFYVKPEGR